MLNQQDIVNFVEQFDYDIKKSGSGRWIDQKCTADVLTVVSDCIFNFIIENRDKSFTTAEIWHSDYTVTNVESIFKKPSVKSESAKNEYDKFFQQPMELLSYSNVLKKVKIKKRNVYSVNNIDVLEYIALREKNSLYFLGIYIEKVLKDSGIIQIFNDFFNNQTVVNYNNLKLAFSDFTIKYTPINGITECNRIFIKVLNPLAYFRNSKGTEKGQLSKGVITYDLLMYNRNNFRDIFAEKPKEMTRKEFKEKNPIIINEAYYKYQTIKAKHFLRNYNIQVYSGVTEHREIHHLNELAIHIHHIFPEAMYPEISYFIENLISLTPTQHLSYAHPNGNTSEVNRNYQYLLILSKIERIIENFQDTINENIYDFKNLLYVLCMGLDNDEFMQIEDMDFISVINAVNISYL